MASGPIASWQMDGETMEAVTDFVLGGAQLTARRGIASPVAIRRGEGAQRKRCRDPRPGDGPLLGEDSPPFQGLQLH